MGPPLRTAVAALLAAVLGAPPAWAEEPVRPEIRVHYYPIRGTTAAELKAQMAANGPQGWWAYTRWFVRWTGDCKVTVSIDYTMPKWLDEGEAPAGLQDNWNRMFVNLWNHELGHGRHGVIAANEIVASRCAGNPRDITDRWAEQDRIYDSVTRHGVNQGVALPE
ncbi:MAG: hypothetical protein BroJett030_04600 [Alphaproteobacteria bacterium]|nr:MAG: hypothetical protein BroJett030_04600 [Alphaproteobacteria bacterium]